MAIFLQIIQRCFAGPYDPAEEVAAAAEPGDLIEFNRGSYSHYALSIGNRKVISIRAGLADKTALVEEVGLVALAKDGMLSGCSIRREYHDLVAQQYFKKKPKSGRESVKEARKFLKRKVPYELFLRNCEYYCTLWKYGKGFSTQVIHVKLVTGRSRYEKFAKHCKTCKHKHNFNRACHCEIDRLISSVFIDGLEL